MKKIIRLLGVTLVLVSLNSCSKDDVPVDGTVELTQKNLIGLYKIQKVTVPIAVDLDGDGTSNTNLLLETGRNCVWDNTWEFAGPSMYINDAGTKCDPAGKVRILDESFKIDATTKIITFASGDTKPYNNVQLSTSNGLKLISFETEDNTSLKQIRSFTLVEVK